MNLRRIVKAAPFKILELELAASSRKNVDHVPEHQDSLCEQHKSAGKSTEHFCGCQIFGSENNIKKLSAN